MALLERASAHLRTHPNTAKNAALFCGVGLAGSWLASWNPVGVVFWLFVALMAVGLVHRRRRGIAWDAEQRRLYALRAQHVETYLAMDAREFEAAVAYLCTRDGCSGVRVVGGAGDLGADVVATAPDGRSLVIQCKRYDPARKVGSQDLQRFGGTCFQVHGAGLAAVVTTSAFTRPAAQYAHGMGITLCDQQGLAAWASGTGPAPWAR